MQQEAYRPMNTHEKRAWRALIDMGARPIDIGGKPALDLSTVVVPDVGAFVAAVVNVAGRSGSVRRHVNRRNEPVFVVTDDPAAEELS